MTWKRILLYAVALNFVLFFRGCDQSGDVQFTTGAFVPYQLLEIDDDWASAGFRIGGEQGIQILEFSWFLLLFNVALVAAVFFGLQKSSKRLAAFLGGRLFLVIAILAFIIFNSGLIPNHAWVYGVFWPTGYIYEGALSLFYAGPSTAEPNAYIDIAARLYFLIFITVLSLICLFFLWIKRRTEPPLPPGGAEESPQGVGGDLP